MNTKTYISLLVIVTAGIAVYFLTRTETSKTPILLNSVTYACNEGKKINAEFYEVPNTHPSAPNKMPVPTGSTKLTFENGTSMMLSQTISADGGRYANKDESFIFWSKGNGAMVLQNNEEKDYTGCIMVSKDSGAGLPQTYANATKGFSIRLGEGYKADESYVNSTNAHKNIPGVKFTIPASMATGTNLGSDTGISVEQVPSTDACTADLFLEHTDKKPATITDGDREYSMATFSDAAAGNRYEETVYAFPGSAQCLGVRYFIHYGVFENYPKGAIKEFDKEALIKQFDDIRRSITTN